jgi:hypothetical protein
MPQRSQRPCAHAPNRDDREHRQEHQRFGDQNSLVKIQTESTHAAVTTAAKFCTGTIIITTLGTQFTSVALCLFHVNNRFAIKDTGKM